MEEDSQSISVIDLQATGLPLTTNFLDGKTSTQRKTAFNYTRTHVRFGSKATCAPHKVMSALHPKADMCGATTDVRFGPIADIGTQHFELGLGRQPRRTA